MEESQLFVHASVPAHVKFKAVMAEVMDSQIPEQQKDYRCFIHNLWSTSEPLEFPRLLQLTNTLILRGISIGLWKNGTPLATGPLILIK